MKMSDSQRHASDKDLTRIAFLQFANTMSNYAAIKEFHNAWHHGFKLRFQMASETTSEYNPKPFIQREYRAKDMVGVEFIHKNDDPIPIAPQYRQPNAHSNGASSTLHTDQSAHANATLNNHSTDQLTTTKKFHNNHTDRLAELLKEKIATNTERQKLAIEKAALIKETSEVSTQTDTKASPRPQVRCHKCLHKAEIDLIERHAMF